MVEDLLKRIEMCETRILYEKHKDNYMDTLVHSYPVLSLEDEKELFKLFRTTHDKKYKDIIFKCHLRDVHDTCKDTTDYRTDLIGEGIVLLCEFIDLYDYTMPYTTFTDQLKVRLTVLYNEKSLENNKSLDTAMSTQDLIGLENNGKCLTDTNEIEPVHKKEIIEPLIIVLKEGIEIVPREESMKPDITAIYKKLFGESPKIKKLKKRYRPPINPDDLGY